MEYVWGFTVLYSGPIGLVVYWYSGRTRIDHDSQWRRGFRSVCRCYSGWGAGGFRACSSPSGYSRRGTSRGRRHVLAGVRLRYATTMGPLVRERMEFREAFVYAFHSETASIAVVEVAAIAGEATMSEPRSRAAPVVSLSAGLIAAHPVNLLLNSRDVTGRMVNPAEMACHTCSRPLPAHRASPKAESSSPTAAACTGHPAPTKRKYRKITN